MGVDRPDRTFHFFEMVGVSCISMFLLKVWSVSPTFGSSFGEVGEDFEADDTLSRTVLKRRNSKVISLQQNRDLIDIPTDGWASLAQQCDHSICTVFAAILKGGQCYPPVSISLETSCMAFLPHFIS